MTNPIDGPFRTYEQALADRAKLRKERAELGICQCGRGFMRAETEMCIHCEDDAQANVVDLDFERVVKITEGTR